MPIYELGKNPVFPPVHHAENGLLAYGGDLSPRRLLEAYRHGIFPWYSEDDPILWWSPDERMILFPEDIHISTRFRRILAHSTEEIVSDTLFHKVIRYCASVPRPQQSGTWILPEMINAYIRLHDMGYAHSIEVLRESRLIGGLYGVSLGGVFFGESMFSLVPNGSKFALIALAEQCRQWGFVMIDCQMYTPHLKSMGARLAPRATFLKLLSQGLKYPTKRGKWHISSTIHKEVLYK